MENEHGRLWEASGKNAKKSKREGVMVRTGRRMMSKPGRDETGKSIKRRRYISSYSNNDAVVQNGKPHGKVHVLAVRRE